MQDYIQKALKTESTNYDAIRDRLQSKGTIRMLHAFVGLSTETGELLEALKKHIFYGKELDRKNIREEAGDVMWYLAVLFDELGISFEEAMQRNVNKLEVRYKKQKFTAENAINRDLEAEEKVI